MSFKTTLGVAIAAGAMSLGTAALADNHGGDEPQDRALVILTSDSLQTQGMAMILTRNMQGQGTDPHILLCDQAGDLAIEGYESDEPFKTPAMSEVDQMTPEAILKMLIKDGAQVDVCAIYLPNSDHGEGDLLEGVGVAAPGPMAEMMRDPSIPVYSF
ncbi:hypothetical protein [Halomonas sp. CKK8]|uniref:hypothetical protein n=1 Tax=Halomonas sp. CKK8 TaxID=3036127 RepID=UPI002415574B|nr:hypothetical protein [Halomonas sp. CKK8]WFM72197.1 hypothetical protein P8934_04115 [Halomonas sp. CKK8]